MKHLKVICTLCISLLVISCSKDEASDDSPAPTPAQEANFKATINGGSLNNYDFTLGIYNVTKGTDRNTLSIEIADPSGQQITLFLNETGGFNNGATKEMGDVDSTSATTYVLFRQTQPTNLYYSSTGTVKITNNRVHPTLENQRLISGEFNINAATLDNESTISMTGTFTELAYDN